MGSFSNGGVKSWLSAFELVICGAIDICLPPPPKAAPFDNWRSFAHALEVVRGERVRRVEVRNVRAFCDGFK